MLSHPDVDHYNALPGVLEKFSVGAVYVSPLMFTKDSEAVAALRRAIDVHDVPVLELQAGDRLRSDRRCMIEVLYPPTGGIIGSENANSLVLSVACQGREILLAGDLQSPGLDDLLSKEPAALRGPARAAPRQPAEQFAGSGQVVSPRYVVLSGDGRWSTAETEATYRAVGAAVFHTYRGGAIRVFIDVEGVHASQFVEAR